MKKVYNKLVRDKFIDIYKYDVENKISMSNYSVRFLEKEEIIESLKGKLREEVEELLDVYGEEDKTHLKEEIADVMEVLDAILYHNKFTLDEVSAIRYAKKEKRGGFKKVVYLESIDYFDEEK